MIQIIEENLSTCNGYYQIMLEFKSRKQLVNSFSIRNDAFTGTESTSFDISTSNFPLDSRLMGLKILTEFKES